MFTCLSFCVNEVNHDFQFIVFYYYPTDAHVFSFCFILILCLLMIMKLEKVMTFEMLKWNKIWQN